MPLSVFDPGPQPPPEYEPEAQLRCPKCGHVDVPDGFDVMGADEDCLFCLRCGHHGEMGSAEDAPDGMGG